MWYVIGLIIGLLVLGAIIDYKNRGSKVCCDIHPDSEFCTIECKGNKIIK